MRFHLAIPTYIFSGTNFRILNEIPQLTFRKHSVIKFEDFFLLTYVSSQQTEDIIANFKYISQKEELFTVTKHNGFYL